MFPSRYPFESTDQEGHLVVLISNSYITGTRDPPMYGIYCTEARGREAARGLSAICGIDPPSAHVITIFYPEAVNSGPRNILSHC
jgi:hypothetical protein